MTALIRFVTFSLVFLAFTANAASGSTTIQVMTSVPVEHDPHLNHTVRELGMSAKQVGQERRWNIHPRFLHATAKIEGTFTVELKKGDTETTIVVTANWEGEPKSPEIQKELEERVRLVAAKIAQTTGISKPKLQCILTWPNGKANACKE